MTTSKLDQYGKKANAFIRAGDRCSSNAEKQYRQAGRELLKAKGQVDHGKWLPYLKKHNISSQRASELIRMADGTLTLEDSREEKRESMIKSRAKLPPRGWNLKNGNGKSEPTIGPMGRPQNIGCNYDPEDPNDVGDVGDSNELIRHHIFMNRMNEVLRHAREIPFDEADDSEIDDEIISTAKKAAGAWSDWVKKLLVRHKKGKSSGKMIEKTFTIFRCQG